MNIELRTNSNGLVYVEGTKLVLRSKYDGTIIEEYWSGDHTEEEYGEYELVSSTRIEFQFEHIEQLEAS